MAAIPRDKINYHKVSLYANVLIFKEFYLKTKNVSYYIKSDLINNVDLMRISGSEPSSVILSQTK